MADDEQNSKIPGGRFSRFARMASLTARTASDLAIGKARRAMGDDSYTQERQAAKKVLETLGTMKGAAMKLGQQLAMEADALPPEAREIVAKLFAQAPAMSYEDIKGVIVEELGDPPEEIFAEFEKTALASASLGQVHKARLKDGTVVAVKVQYPGVAEALVNDLKNASLFVRAFNGTSRSLAKVDATPYYEEIRREIGAETDYLREAKLSAEYAEAVVPFPELHVPKVFSSLSTGRVLTMEFVEGLRINAFAETNATEEERWRVGRQILLALWGPFACSRLAHADPHPGNFLVRPDGRLTVLDFGAVKHLSPTFADNFWELMQAELDCREPDFMPVLTAAGYTFKGDLTKAHDTVKGLHDIIARPIRRPFFDWGTDTIISDVRSYFTGNLKDVFEVQAPPESLLFYRAVGGMAQNLHLIRSRGPFRDVVVELGEMRRRKRAA